MAVLADTEPFAAKVKALRCFKGIDTAAAMGLATELISPERFLSGREVMSYAGLSIVEYSSGESQRRSGITKSGNAHLRRVLVRASQHARKPVTRESKALQVRRKAAPAWAAELGRRAERRLHEKHRGLVNRGKPENVAVTAVARELAGWIWACMMHDIQASAAGPTGVSADGVSLT